MDYQDIQKRLLAAQTILDATTSTRAKFASLQTLLKGINPRLDKTLNDTQAAWSHLDKISRAEVVELTAEALPEFTEKDKQRKKALLLLIRFWKQLQGEVKRVTKELENSHAHAGSNPLGRIATFAKGPLGIITIAAVAIVYVNSLAATIIIKNRGCDTLEPKISLPISIAGVKLPSDPIPDGGEGRASLPPLSLAVDGTQNNLIKFKVLGISLSFEMNQTNTFLSFDGKSLLGGQTQIQLASRSTHDLVILCK